ncbi:MAG TPA: glycosyltransferase [Saprospiraceae bacterium]|nr:glycosyltransferase [Lacibacter sp.]HMO89989.1 glycosyltransferase [Lacibacter sp.]HMQ08612.1 glycosyltransferase [Saprospiraceae bacterium]
MSVFFSIVIPTYQQHQYISDCVNSFLNQSFCDFEIIISDDSEDDLTLNICRSLTDKRIRYFKNEPRLGRVGNYRLNALERATGKWLIICDGDDCLTDIHYLNDAKKIIDQHSSLTFIQAGHLKGDSINSSAPELPHIADQQLFLNGFDYLMRFQEIAHFSHLSTLSNLEHLRKINPFRLNILSSDVDSYLRLVFYGDVYLLKKPVGFWRQHQHNASSTSGVSSIVKNLTWIGSVATFWINHCANEQKSLIRQWEKSTSKNAIRFLFREMIRNKTTDWITVRIFFYEAFRMRFLFHLVSDRQTYRYLMQYLKRRKD